MIERKVLVVIGYLDTFEENVNKYLKRYEDWNLVYQQFFAMEKDQMKAVFLFDRKKEVKAFY